jgi:FMN phosphatase YigB (HAD superfamily)
MINSMKQPAFLFDIGNVLVRFDFSTAAVRFAKLSTANADEVLERLSSFKDELESGRISDDDFVRQSIERIGFRGTSEEFKLIWGDIFTENSPMVALVKELAGRHPLYLFSNTSGLHKQWLFENFDVFQQFSGGVYSHEVRCMKPHDAFYQAAIEQYGLDPAQTFYIDDLPDNIATGQRLGFVCHRYSPDEHEALEDAVETWIRQASAPP